MKIRDNVLASRVLDKTQPSHQFFYGVLVEKDFKKLVADLIETIDFCEKEGRELDIFWGDAQTGIVDRQIIYETGLWAKIQKKPPEPKEVSDEKEI